MITRYEIEPATGVKGSQIVGLARDLARALSVMAIRVVETIPGTSCMGLEIPNPKREIVRLALAVLQIHLVLFARPATVAVVFSRREKRAKHAMLHMKHRHVLMDRHLEPLGRRGAHQRFQLRDVEIV